jgi:hypothetical protein
MDEPKFEPGEWSGHEMATEVAERIRSVIAAAEAAAGAVRHEAEQQAAGRRRAAEEEARHIVDDARRDAQALLEERVRRISGMSDTILERSEGLLSRLDRADEVRRELQMLVDELGQTAAKLAGEAGAQKPAPAPEPRRVKPEPEPVAEPEPAPEPVRPAAVEEATAEKAAEPEPAPPEPEPAELPAEEPSTPPLRVAEEQEEVSASVTDLLSRPQQPTRAEEDDQLLGARLVALQMAVAGGNRGEVEAHLIRAFDLPNPQSILDDVFGRGTDSSKRVVWPSAADGS